MYHWITIVGSRPVASLNTLWFARNQYADKQIGKITLLHDQAAKKHLSWFTKHAEILFKYDMKKSPEFIPVLYVPKDIDNFRKTIKRILSTEKNKLIIDMTSGRKAHSAILLLMGELFSGVVEHVFYNFLDEERYLNFPYPCIPMSVNRILDLLE